MGRCAFSVILLLLLFHSISMAQYQCTKWRNKNKCEQNGCYWWNNKCWSYRPTCTDLNNQADCERFGFYWWGGKCNCSPMTCSDLTTQADCATYGCFWWNNKCWGTAPLCSQLNNQADCQAYGCYWYNGACYSNRPSCEILNNQTDCERYGCYWYDGACHSESVLPQPPQVSMPCAVPPFLSETVTPNVLVILDNSGSMNWPAYFDPASNDPTVYDYGSYIHTLRYYGYADPDSYYQYGTNRFEITTTWKGTADPANKRFSGNFLNWMLSRRIDIARQVICGGKCASRQFSGRKTLIWESPAQTRNIYKYWWCDDGCRWQFVNYSDQYVYAYKYSSCTSGS